MLRTVEALRLEGFISIMLVTPKKNMPGADIFCEKDGKRICVEVKAITKQSKGRPNLFLEDQLYEKILESVSKARLQLEATSLDLKCEVKILTCASNWFDQAIYLVQNDYQLIVNRLERDSDQESLIGIDGVLFVTKMGQQFFFMKETRIA